MVRSCGEMDNERLLKKVMNAKVDGRSARGRPRFGWMDGVKRALNDRRMDMRRQVSVLGIGMSGE